MKNLIFKHYASEPSKRVLLFLMFLKICHFTYSQCGPIINTFPYQEGFENAPEWTTGGVNSDWAWGTPSHPTISDAAEGSKSWCVGGLNGSSYNANQLSYLMSPCFDFSNLDFPWISFQVFWETEFQWDGAVLQYTIDGGGSWINVGNYNDPENCLTANWYNYNSIFWLTDASPKHGWSGRVGSTSGSCQGGNGSGDWLTAKHCMAELGGQEEVRFRFLFGSGNSCNDYDGFAIDDILIENTSPTNANFSSNCISSNEVSFLNLSNNCASTYLWNFGDPSSGVLNASASINPTHIFSGPGTYPVSLTSNGPCNQAGIFTQVIKILPNQTSKIDVSCFGANNGSASVQGAVTSNYSWNTNPIQHTQTIENLAPGTYTVQIEETNACPNQASVTIVEPPELQLNVTTIPSCTDFCNGSIETTISGGTGPYLAQWNSLGTGEDFIGNVCAGFYNLTVTDFNNCQLNQTVEIEAMPNPVIVCEPANLCIGSSAELLASGADFYSWSPSTFLNTSTGSNVITQPANSIIYTVTGTTNFACSSSTTVEVNVSDVFAPIANFTYTPTELDIYNTEVSFSNLSSGATSFLWNFAGLAETNELNPSFIFPNDEAGNYTVCLEVENEIHCIETFCQTIEINGKASFYLPNSFSPNGDELNNVFAPVIKDIEFESYSLSIYNKWGELIFESYDPSVGWDGTYQNSLCQAGIYLWKIVYNANSELTEGNGFVNLIK